MAKRQRAVEDTGEIEVKRNRLSHPDRLSKLSDELTIKVLSYLSIQQLAACSRLSSQFETLANDSQLWKEHYYNRFVRPRASTLPGIRDNRENKLYFASKASKWLDEDHLVNGEVKTDWKLQYKTRHRWSRGDCKLKEVLVAEHQSVPPTLVQMHGRTIYTADSTSGLRAWAARGERKIVAHIPLSGVGEESISPPTALAINAVSTGTGGSRIAIGYEDGSFALYELHPGDGGFEKLYSHVPSSNGVMSSISLCWPYVVTLTATQVLSLYKFTDPAEASPQDRGVHPRLLQSIRSHTAWPPLTTALRVFSKEIVVSLAFSQPTYLSGWTVAIQEFRLDFDGVLSKSRMLSAIDQHYRPVAFSLSPTTPHLMAPSIGTTSASSNEPRHIHSKPTSLSYTHPYLLASHPDNTLTLYLVHSDPDTMSIGTGTRLWGHTSAVSGVHVGGYGKAVSVSARGDELRVWELEGGFSSSAGQRKLTQGDMSVRIVPETRPANSAAASQAGLDLVHDEPTSEAKDSIAADEDEGELTLSRGWIGFDDENVVVLKESSRGKQSLAFYDFT